MALESSGVTACQWMWEKVMTCKEVFVLCEINDGVYSVYGSYVVRRVSAFAVFVFVLGSGMWIYTYGLHGTLVVGGLRARWQGARTRRRCI